MDKFLIEFNKDLSVAKLPILLVKPAPTKKKPIQFDYKMYLPPLKPNTALGKNKTIVFKAIWGVCINDHYFLGLKNRKTHRIRFFVDDKVQQFYKEIKKSLWQALRQLPIKKEPFLFEEATGQTLDTITRGWAQTKS